jgi:hypothetical protein
VVVADEELDREVGQYPGVLAELHHPGHPGEEVGVVVDRLVVERPVAQAGRHPPALQGLLLGEPFRVAAVGRPVEPPHLCCRPFLQLRGEREQLPRVVDRLDVEVAPLRRVVQLVKLGARLPHGRSARLLLTQDLGHHPCRRPRLPPARPRRDGVGVGQLVECLLDGALRQPGASRDARHVGGFPPGQCPVDPALVAVGVEDVEHSHLPGSVAHCRR